MKRLYKDPSNKMICGVCSGLANYLNVDPTVIRLLWAIAIVFVGAGLWIYLICALVIPEDPNVYNNNEQYWQQQQQQYNQQQYYNPDPNQQYNNQGTYYDPTQNNNNNQ
ncbi:MAG: PspC domain-containing protein [Eubacterium sp.]|nr:PspC domain-containing protein [Eubacterium sp.]